MSDAFDAAALQRRYAFLDDCPEDLLHQLVTLPAGSIQDRVAGALRWRGALLAGRMPPEDGWPPRAIAEPVRRALAEMNLARFCEGQPELVDALLRDIISAFARQADTLQSEVAARLRELELLERARRTEEEEARAQREKRTVRKIRVDEATLRRLREEAARDAAQREREADAALLADWGDRARAWAEIADVFGDLGEMMGRGWDLSLGVLRHTGWLDLLRLRQLVEQLPQLREIVRALGRLHASEQEPSVAERILLPVRRVEEEVREVRTPHVPAETRGVERSGEIARMLPAEASMLGHPKLRLLWHARRAERALLTYRVEGVETERVWVEHDAKAETEGRRPRPERGPIVAVIDTSGSMHGAPEQVAKALVLEALRTAHAERRRCVLYAYSGPGQVLEHELDLTHEGVGRLLAFMGASFGGGNDEAGVITHVLARLKEEQWARADVIFVSDGEWPAPPSNLIAAVGRAREDGTRFHGVQIGNRGPTGLHAFCEPVHVFQDWAALGGWNR
jgi:uncharacterized protein with von Willebrand factor type A (vWA) domain